MRALLAIAILFSCATTAAHAEFEMWKLEKIVFTVDDNKSPFPDYIRISREYNNGFVEFKLPMQETWKKYAFTYGKCLKSESIQKYNDGAPYELKEVAEVCQKRGGSKIVITLQWYRSQASGQWSYLALGTYEFSPKKNKLNFLRTNLAEGTLYPVGFKARYTK